MSDRFIPLGQNIPKAQIVPIQQVPSSYNTQRDKSGELSFEEVFRQQQMASIESRAMRPMIQPYSQSMNSSSDALENNNTRPSIQDQPALQTIAQSNSQILPENDRLAELIMNNMVEYQQQKNNPVNVQSNPSTGGMAFTQPNQLSEAPELKQFRQSQLPDGNTSSALHAVLSNNHPQMIQSGQTINHQGMMPHLINPTTISSGSMLGMISQSRKANDPHGFDRESPTEKIEQKQEQESRKEQTERKGFFSAAGSFFGNIASAATLGFYRPKGEPEPTGILRVVDPFKKIVWDTPKSLIVDAPVGIYHDVSRSSKSNQSLDQEEAAIASNEQPKKGRNRGRYNHSLASLNHPTRAFRNNRYS